MKQDQEINKPEEFSVGMSNAPQPDSEQSQQGTDEVEYTPQEMEFADGKGTGLADEFPQGEDNEQTDSEETDSKDNGRTSRSNQQPGDNTKT